MVNVEYRHFEMFISKIMRLTKNCNGHKLCVPFSSTIYIANIFAPIKYVVSYS
jgi:hypothetical protein